jgi:bifunctional DNA-binding transcriptional regulator/antitoxin component of YhaV-PrlF toxin-antitoxin module
MADRNLRFHKTKGITMGKRVEIIESTAGQVTAELTRRGIRPQDRVTITIDPEQDSLFLGRKKSRARVVAAGLTDKDIERLIEEAREEVQPHLG